MADSNRIICEASPIILPFEGRQPRIHESAWIAPGAVVIGDTEIGAECSIWFGAVIRGDINRIRIGNRTNIQDGTVCHVNLGKADLIIGDSVTVGHCVALHGCKLNDNCLIGIGARILDHVEVGSFALIAAGSVVREGTKVPSGELWAGIPAVKKRDLTAEEKKELIVNADHYVDCRLQYMMRGKQ